MPDDGKKQKVQDHLANIAGNNPTNTGGQPGEGAASPTVKTTKPTDEQKHVIIGDYLNYSLAKGGNPTGTKQGRLMFQTVRDLYGDKTAHDLVDQIMIYNQRPENQKASAEDKINGFFEKIHGSPELEKLKGKVNSFDYGASSRYHDSLDIDTQDLQGNDMLAKK